ncbi:Uncharacterised protein [Mycobacterium tuberculosis]|nr:Uncharacterised protein [Mycobacterium tuberculosis]
MSGACSSASARLVCGPSMASVTLFSGAARKVRTRYSTALPSASGAAGSYTSTPVSPSRPWMLAA